MKVREFAHLLIRRRVCFRRTELLKELTDLRLKFSEESKCILSLRISEIAEEVLFKKSKECLIYSVSLSEVLDLSCLPPTVSLRN